MISSFKNWSFANCSVFGSSHFFSVSLARKMYWENIWAQGNCSKQKSLFTGSQPLVKAAICASKSLQKTVNNEQAKHVWQHLLGTFSCNDGQLFLAAIYFTHFFFCIWAKTIFTKSKGLKIRYTLMHCYLVIINGFQKLLKTSEFETLMLNQQMVPQYLPV